MDLLLQYFTQNKYRLVMTWTRPSVSKRGTLISFQARHFLGFQMRHLLVVKAQESVIFWKIHTGFTFTSMLKEGFPSIKTRLMKKREMTKRTSLFDLFSERPNWILLVRSPIKRVVTTSHKRRTIFQPRCLIETSQSTSRTRQQILVKLTIPIGCKLRHPLDKEWSLLVARNGQR